MTVPHEHEHEYHHQHDSYQKHHHHVTLNELNPKNSVFNWFFDMHEHSTNSNGFFSPKKTFVEKTAFKHFTFTTILFIDLNRIWINKSLKNKWFYLINDIKLELFNTLSYRGPPFLS
jgi:hypothetical protein